MKNDSIVQTFLLFRRGVRQLAAIFGAFALAIILASLLLAAQYFVHEGGHLAGCYLTGWAWQLPVSCSITNIRTIPIYPGILEISAPQQTQSDNVHGSPLVYFGGPVLSIVFFILLGVCLNYALKCKSKAYWLIFCGFILSEIYGNALCGTDNPTGNPFDICKMPALALFNQLVLVIFAIIPITYLLYPSALRTYDGFDARAVQFLQRMKSGKHDALYSEKRKGVR